MNENCLVQCSMLSVDRSWFSFAGSHSAAATTAPAAVAAAAV